MERVERCDAMGKYCACACCIDITRAVASDFANGGAYSYYGTVGDVGRVIGGLAIWKLFELAGLGDA